MRKKTDKTENPESFDQYTLKPPQQEGPAAGPGSTGGPAAANTFWSGRGKFWLGMILLCLLLAVIAGAYVFNHVSGRQNQPLPSPTAQESPAPSPAAPDRATLTIEVLNGSGVAGSAAKAQSLLESLGYENVTVGNADSYNFQTTQVAIKASKQDHNQVLINDLSGQYEATSAVTFLDESGQFDAIVTIGAN